MVWPVGTVSADVDTDGTSLHHDRGDRGGSLSPYYIPLHRRSFDRFHDFGKWLIFNQQPL
ncbi:hypothetical protein D8S78_19030 [Natrialba swarupiae]|nr:hypothetical protein [Natrialba swarupiae]